MAETGCRTDRLEALLASETVTTTTDAAADPLRHVYEIAFSFRADTAIDAAEEALRNAEFDPVLRLHLLGVLVSLHLSNQDEASAELVFVQRLTVLAATGRQLQHNVEAKLGLILFRAATKAELPLLLAELETRTTDNAPPAVLGDLSFSAGSVHAESGAHFEATLLMRSAAGYYHDDGNIDGEAAALLYLAGSLVALGDEDGAVDVIDRTLRLPAARAIHASLLMLRSGTGLGTPSRAQSAIDDALSALEIYQTAGIRPGAIAAAAMVGQELLELGEASDAALALRIAADQAELNEHPTLPILRLNLGNALLQAREFAGAMSSLSDAQRLLATTGAAQEERASALAGLGHAQRQSGLTDDALASWQEAVLLFESTGQFAEQARILLATGTLLAREGQPEAARAVFDSAVAAARREEQNPLALPEALHTCGYAHCEAGNATGLIQLEEALELAASLNSRWLVANFTDSKARALATLGRPGEAVANALAAADSFAEAGDASSAGNAELFAGQVLLAAGEGVEAEAIIRNAIGHMGKDPGLRVAAWTAIGDALDTLDKPEEARVARKRATEIAAGATG